MWNNFFIICNIKGFKQKNISYNKNKELLLLPCIYIDAYMCIGWYIWNRKYNNTCKDCDKEQKLFSYLSWYSNNNNNSNANGDDVQNLFYMLIQLVMIFPDIYII